MKEEIKKIINEALRELKIEETDFAVEHPADLKNGDYSVNVAMVLAKQLGSNPRELAEQIAQSVRGQHVRGPLTPEHARGPLTRYPQVEKVEVAGAGFLNFYLSRKFFADSIAEILEKNDNFGKNEEGKGKKVIIEYSSPNIAKPFTIGHLRSTIIGHALANIFEYNGYEVLRDNHLGDWGTQFGKLIVAIKRYGNEEEIGKAERPVKALTELYVKFHAEAEKDKTLEDEARAWFTKLEQGDKEARAIWQKCVDWSMTEFSKIYERLGASFDMTLGESFFEDKMKTVIEDLEKTDFYKESEGAKLVFFPDEKHPPLMIQKKDGSTLYGTRDLATDKYRRDTWNPDLVVNEVGMEQSLYFKQLFEVEEMLGYFKKEQRVHVAHGLYKFKEGKMSTRKGNVIWLEDVLDEAKKRAGKINEETAEVVGIGAIKFNDLRSESRKDIIFNWGDILNLDGDSGPYVQYSYVRTKAIENKAKELGIEKSIAQPTEEIFEIEKLLYRFPEVVSRARETYAPHVIAQYLLEVAHEFSSFYGNTQVLKEEDPFSPYKLAVVEATGIVIKKGLWILGIQTPEKM
ncbi:MAG TPA: arginine--tRNA ligase [Candidatus Paceibacterota bacterium]|nr:arginine--tRNA ligase [Candidatus Paceibacterota bacterium]